VTAWVTLPVVDIAMLDVVSFIAPWRQRTVVGCRPLQPHVSGLSTGALPQ
jgi:hypothetical protein